MVFTNHYIDAAAQLLAAQVTGLGAGLDLTIALFTNDITPDPTTQFDDLVLATAPGIAEKAGVAGAAKLVWDKTAGVWGFSVTEGAPGFTFILSAPQAPAIIAYGYAVIDGASGALIAAQKFETPAEFARVGDYVEVSSIVGWLAAPFIGDLPRG